MKSHAISFCKWNFVVFESSVALGNHVVPATMISIVVARWATLPTTRVPVIASRWTRRTTFRFFVNVNCVASEETVSVDPFERLFRSLVTLELQHDCLSTFLLEKDKRIDNLCTRIAGSFDFVGMCTSSGKFRGPPLEGGPPA